MGETQEPMSISDAFDKGLAEMEQSDEGSSEETDQESNDTNDDKGTEGDVTPDNKNDDDKENGGADKKADTTQKKEPVVDPDKGSYEGEYTKERFNGLMSQWQRDRAALNDPERLKAQLTKLGVKFDQPNKPAEDIKPEEVELPPELQNADEASKEGFKLVMKGLQGQLSKVEQRLLGKVMDTLNAPLKQENEAKTKVTAEIEELKKNNIAVAILNASIIIALVIMVKNAVEPAITVFSLALRNPDATLTSFLQTAAIMFLQIILAGVVDLLCQIGQFLDANEERVRGHGLT